MTNKDRLISLLGFAPADNNSLDGELLDIGLVGTDNYDPSNSVAIKKCAISVMQLLLTTADTVDSTSSFSITWDRSAVEARIKILKGELGIIDDSMPVIRGMEIW